MNSSTPAFFADEIRSFQSSHLVIGIESRDDKGALISRWSASAVEIVGQQESHLEMCIRSHNSLQGKKSLMLLLELGQYLECVRSNIILPPLKRASHGDKVEKVLSLIGFHKTADTDVICSAMLEDKTKSASIIPASLNIGGIMSYDYPSGIRVPSPPTIESLPSELSPKCSLYDYAQNYQIPLKAY